MANVARALPGLCAVVCLATACDNVGRPNGRTDAVPDVAKPRVVPVEIKPPTVDRSNVGQVRVVNPPDIDAVQIDVLQQSDGIVDILWVIDDSGSMANQRKVLGNNFQVFFDRLDTLLVNFQMGVTSTNMVDNGALRGTTKIITNMTPDAGAIFVENTSFPDSRARWEQGLRMGQFAVSSPNTDPGGVNDGFLRPNAALALIVVSNEDDSSFGTTGYYGRAFLDARGTGHESLVCFSQLAGTTPTGCTPEGEEPFFGRHADPAFRYSAVSTLTGGIIGSICDTSFENTLLQIAEALNTLHRVFPLSLIPVGGTLSVTVNGVTIPMDPVNGWSSTAPTPTASSSWARMFRRRARSFSSRTRSRNDARRRHAVRSLAADRGGALGRRVLAHRADPRVPERLHVRRYEVRVLDR